MRNKLIHFFGGITNEEMKTIDANYEHWRARCEKAEEKIKELQDEVKLKNERIEAMIELLVTRIGHAAVEKPPPSGKPIQTLPMSWPRARRELERKDRKEKPPDAKIS